MNLEKHLRWEVFLFCNCIIFAVMIFTAFAILIRVLSNPIANVFQKQLTDRGNGPMTVNAVTYLTLSVICVAPAFSVNWLAMPSGFWLNCLLVGMLGGVGNAFLVKALQNGQLSVLGPINSYKSVVGMIVGVIVLGEIPNIFGLLGVALIIGGSYFVLNTPEERFSWRLLKRNDIRYRVYAMVFTAVEAVFIKKVIMLSSPSVSFIVWCWFGTVASFVIIPVFARSERIAKIKRKELPRFFYVAACVGLMQYTTNFIFDRMEVGYALALFQLSTIISVLLGYRIFREGDIRNKLIGSAVMVAGSMVIIFLN